MVTSDTGHDRVPVSIPGPLGARRHHRGGDKEIKKARSGFKGFTKFFGVTGDRFNSSPVTEELGQATPPALKSLWHCVSWQRPL
jgi:hypothetical protein